MPKKTPVVFSRKFKICEGVKIRPSSDASKVSLYHDKHDEIYELEGDAGRLLLQFQEATIFNDAVKTINPAWFQNAQLPIELEEFLDFLLSQDILEKV